MAPTGIKFRVLSLLAIATIVFAPAPADVNATERLSLAAPKDSLAAQILSPTFDEGVIRAEAGSSVVEQFKRFSPATTFAILPALAFSVLLLCASSWVSGVQQRLVLRVVTSVATRAPPVSPVT